MGFFTGKMTGEKWNNILYVTCMKQNPDSLVMRKLFSEHFLEKWLERKLRICAAFRKLISLGDTNWWIYECFWVFSHIVFPFSALFCKLLQPIYAQKAYRRTQEWGLTKELFDLAEDKNNTWHKSWVMPGGMPTFKKNPLDWHFERICFVRQEGNVRVYCKCIPREMCLDAFIWIPRLAKNLSIVFCNWTETFTRSQTCLNVAYAFW